MTKAMIASPAVTFTLPVADAPYGNQPEQIHEQDEEERRQQVRHVPDALPCPCSG